MTRIAILDDYQNLALRFADWSRVQAAAEVVVFNHPLGDIDEAAAALADFDILCAMRERMPMPRALIEALPRLKLIVATGARNRSLDLAACAERGVLVCHTRSGGSEHPTSELTWGLILSAARHLGAEERNLRAGGWQMSVGRTLHGRTLGVVGLGRIGARVACYGKAFGMEVVAWSQNLTEARAAEVGVRRVSKSELFAASDVISLHLVLSERSRGIVGRQDLARMRQDAILVNTSRGPLVDEEGLIEALEARRIGGAALDVFETEPLPPDHPFRRLDNVVVTPHIGYVTRETYEVFFQDTVEDVEAFLAGAPVRVLKAG